MNKHLLPVLALGTLSAILPTSQAFACGGFFCNRSVPIDQNAERIIFAIEDDGTVESHVQIFYQGDAEDFAWIVPAPSEPSLFLSSETLFSQVTQITQPQFNLNRIEEGNCKQPFNIAFSEDMAFATPDSAGSESSVVVVSESQVGPYDTAVLLADSAEMLLDWLQENNYDLPDSLDAALQPYVAEGSYFVALRLQSDKSTGDIAPIGMSYKGDKAVIPIQLTSIAATPDMRLETYVFGAHRAVPESYLHVKINEALIDWFGFGQNYADVITTAANEAGGHAFATDFSGSTANFSGTFYREGMWNLEPLRNVFDPEDFIRDLRSQGFLADSSVLNLFMKHIPMPEHVTASDEGVTAQNFYDCMNCYLSQAEINAIDFDPNALVDDLLTYVVGGLVELESLMTRHDKFSRLTSSVSPIEMTVDPTFVLNPDMGDVELARAADLVYLCTGGKYRARANREIRLSDGRVIALPSENWFERNETTESEFLAQLEDVSALIIEETGTTGNAALIYDGTADSDAQLDAFNKWVRRTSGCGCNIGAVTPLGATSLALVMGAFVRRRRNGSRS